MQHTDLYWVFSQKNEICVSGRHVQACCTRPRPLTPPPCQNSAKGRCAETWNAKGKTVLQAQTSFAILCFCLQNIFSWTWCEIQPSGDPYTEFMLCIYPSKVHTHSSEYTHTVNTHPEQFFLQYFIFFCNSLFLFTKSTLFFLNTFIFSCKTLFSFAILQFSCKYTRHCFDSILNPPISTTKPTHLHPLDVDPTPPPGSLFCS